MKSAFAGIASQAATYNAVPANRPSSSWSRHWNRSADKIHVRLSNMIQTGCMDNAQTGDPKEPVSQAQTPL